MLHKVRSLGINLASTWGMRRVSCRQVLPRDCEWEFVAATDEDIVERATIHARVMHGYELSLEDKQKLRALIKTG